MKPMKIAIVGTGIAGLGAAWLLHDRHAITVYEKEARIGGHSNTVDIDYDGRQLSVDTGFIVFNETNYKNLTALFERLGVASYRSPMSFSVSTGQGGLEWSSHNWNTIFAQRLNAFRPGFWTMLKDIVRFNRNALSDMESDQYRHLSLADYLSARRFSRSFQNLYILPMGAAIWSTSLGDMRDFPAAALVRFFNNHRLLSTRRPQWQTVLGGSRAYVDKLIKPFKDRIRTKCGIAQITRQDGGVTVTDIHGNSERYDHVIMASHSDESLAMLGDADNHERAVLGALPYGPNKAYLHRDPGLMPRHRRVWSSWNVRNDERASGNRVCVSYWMNMLQDIDPSRDVFVTLNPAEAPREELTFAEFDYAHPQFDQRALLAQSRIPEIQGVRNTWFCGAWCGYGFHEDGLKAGLSVAERLGNISRPWAHGPECVSAVALADAAE